MASKDELEQQIADLRNELEQLKDAKRDEYAQTPDTHRKPETRQNASADDSQHPTSRRAFLKKAGALGAAGLSATMLGKHASAYQIRSNNPFTVANQTGNVNFEVGTDGTIDLQTNDISNAGSISADSATVTNAVTADSVDTDETDTARLYSPSRGVDVVVHEDGGTYYASGATAVSSGSDVTTVVQAAVDAAAGGTCLLKLPDATELGEITVPARTTVTGPTSRNDPSAPRLQLAAGITTAMFVSTGNDVVIKNLYLRGNKDNGNGEAAIDLDGNACRVKNCMLNWFDGNGIEISGQVCKVRGNRGQNINGHLIYITGPDNDILDNDGTTSGGGSGIYCDSSNNKILGNNMFTYGNDGITVTSAGAKTTVANNRVNHNSRSGIVVEATRCEISSNRCQENDVDGLDLRGAQISVTGGTYFKNGRQGIRVVTNDDHSITGGLFQNNGQDGTNTDGERCGILLYDVTDVSITGTQILDNQATKTQQYGIREAGSSADYNLITGNSLRGNVTNLSTAGTNTVAANNIS